MIITAIVIIFGMIFLQRLIYRFFAFKNFKVSYSFSQTEVNEGDIFYVTEMIENKKYLPLPAVSTILETGAGLAFTDGDAKIVEQKNVFCFYTVGPYKKITRTWRIKAVHRGRFNIDSITIHLRDLFGLLRLSKDFLCDTDVLVLPAGYPTNNRAAAVNFTGGERAVKQGYYTNPFETPKILPYTYAEPLNKINWKASAKSGALMINAEQPAISEKILVVLDTSEKHHLEKNIKICATLEKVLSEENEITFVSNGFLPEGCKNPLVALSGDEFIRTSAFNLGAHRRNFKRLLAEIEGNYEEFYNIAGAARALSEHRRAQHFTAEKLAETVQKSVFSNSVLLVKGGKIYDYESGENLYF